MRLAVGLIVSTFVVFVGLFKTILPTLRGESPSDVLPDRSSAASISQSRMEGILMLLFGIVGWIAISD